MKSAHTITTLALDAAPCSAAPQSRGSAEGE
jgi:hypothetical protein